MNSKTLITILSILLLFCNCSSNTTISEKLLKEYNNKIEIGYRDNNYWVKSPLTIAIELSKTGLTCKKTSIVMQMLNTGEKASNVMINIKEEGVLDDSDDTNEYNFFLKKRNERWIAYSQKQEND